MAPGMAQNIEYRILLSQSRPKPPPRLPPNRTRPGGGLNPAKQACKAEEQSLTALLPEENPVLSASPYPTFLFYVPDSSDDISSMEFSLFTMDEKQRIFSSRFDPQEIPGVVSVSIPEEPEYALEAGQPYRWYFKVYCSSDTGEDGEPVTVDGWINRVSNTAERQSQVEAVSPEVWYDSLALVARQLRTSPEDSVWRNHWLSLLERVGLEDLAEANISSPANSASGTTANPQGEAAAF